MCHCCYLCASCISFFVMTREVSDRSRLYHQLFLSRKYDWYDDHECMCQRYMRVMIDLLRIAHVCWDNLHLLIE